MELLLSLLGLILIVEGLPYFAFPQHAKRWLAKLQETPDEHLRVMGLAAMLLGLLLSYLARG